MNMILLGETESSEFYLEKYIPVNKMIYLFK